tara:strand:- start:173 stop:589 length:417 start_codon:yes stop_codon:yes gene_type:complete
MIKKLLGIVVLGLLLSTNVSIAELNHEWTKVQKTKSGGDGYVDLINLYEGDDGYIMYWDMVDFGKADRNGVRSNAFLWEGYCNTFRFSLIKRVFYDEAMAKGVGRNIPIKKLKTFIPEPGTFGEKAAQLVCGKKDKNK